MIPAPVSQNTESLAARALQVRGPHSGDKGSGSNRNINTTILYRLLLHAGDIQVGGSLLDSSCSREREQLSLLLSEQLSSPMQ